MAPNCGADRIASDVEAGAHHRPGIDDMYFDVRWSRLLEEAIAGSRRIELKDARLFFSEERAAEFNRELRTHWLARPRQARAAGQPASVAC